MNSVVCNKVFIGMQWLRGHNVWIKREVPNTISNLK